MNIVFCVLAAYPHCFGRIARKLQPPEMRHDEFLSAWAQGRIPFHRTDGQSETDVDVDEDESPMERMKWQFRQISVSDGVVCGITLIGSHLRCWGEGVQGPGQTDSGPRGGKMKYIRDIPSSLPDLSIPAFSEGPYRQVRVLVPVRLDWW